MCPSLLEQHAAEAVALYSEHFSAEYTWYKYKPTEDGLN
jgi:hypothetical protein